MSFLLEGGVVSGKEARAYVIINGRREELFYAKDIEATAEKKKADYEVLGVRATQYKTAGWSGKGSMTLYYVSNTFRRLIMDYIKGGPDVYFDLMVVNDDKASRAGSQTTILKQCNMDSTVLAKVEAETEFLEEDVDFTFSDADMPETFRNVR